MDDKWIFMVKSKENGWNTKQITTLKLHSNITAGDSVNNSGTIEMVEELG